ncbi:hypothetical protein HDU93_000873 [Gonapodya sp. JEL0774]|nr:hypothetical protein HDU93_000873 [Gonapodya sp. JEL0774]
MSNLSFKFSLNLEKEMVFYGSYHSDSRNKLVHLVFVPTILWSGLVWFAHPTFALLPGTFTVPLPLLSSVPISYDVSFFVALGYALYYVGLEPVAGSFYSLFLLLMLSTAHLFRLTTPHAVPLATAVHVLSWAAQIWAHKVYEGRSPALLDNLFQALVLAPLFVWLEVLFAVG